MTQPSEPVKPLSSARQDDRALQVLLATASFTLVASEVALTRLLSAVTWYGQAFFVLSLAMVGLAAGSLDADRSRTRYPEWSAFVASRFARMSVGLLLATTVACMLKVQSGTAWASLLRLFALSVVCTAPLASGGAIVARLMADSPLSTGRLYAVDLGAAALGALAPLILLGPLSAPATLLLLASVAMGASVFNAQKPWRAARLATAMLLSAATALALVGGLHLQPMYLKGNKRPDSAHLRFEQWNALSHVMLTEFATQPMPLWSPSPRAPDIQTRLAIALIDGEAGTPLYAQHDLHELNALRLDAVFTAHELRSTGTSCVIGVGGGRDLAAALIAGHDRVLGVEINPAIIEMHRAARSETQLLEDPRIELKIGDGRVVYARSDVQCRVLQASLVDTWAATAAGAFAHAEATLYTRESWSIFLRRVEPNGILTFSRWYNPAKVDETARLLSLAVASLLDRGVQNPREHIALVASSRVATILVSPEPFSEDDLQVLQRHCERMAFTVVVAPGRAANSQLLESIIAARSLDRLSAVGDRYGLDTSAPTDDRPFFFQLLAPSIWLQPWKSLDSAASGGVIAGNVTAARELLTTLVAVLLVGVFLLGKPLASAFRAKALPGLSAAAYFALLGFAFMLAEVALVQRMHVVLGHPTWALVTVLAALLIAMGVGSLLSTRWLTTASSVSKLCAAIGVLMLLLPRVVIGPLAHAVMESPLYVRAMAAASVSMLLGFFLGMCFPAGLRFVDRTAGAPAALAINGVTGVLGSVAALIVSVAWGIPTTLMIGGLCYGLAALCGPHRWRNAQRSEGEARAAASEVPA
jgi:MFS family permease